MRLYHVSASPHLQQLIAQSGVTSKNGVDAYGIYLSASLANVVWWAETLSVYRRKPHRYVYQVEVPDNQLLVRDFASSGWTSFTSRLGMGHAELLYTGATLSVTAVSQDEVLAVARSIAVEEPDTDQDVSFRVLDLLDLTKGDPF